MYVYVYLFPKCQLRFSSSCSFTKENKKFHVWQWDAVRCNINTKSQISHELRGQRSNFCCHHEQHVAMWNLPVRFQCAITCSVIDQLRVCLIWKFSCTLHLYFTQIFSFQMEHYAQNWISFIWTIFIFKNSCLWRYHEVIEWHTKCNQFSAKILNAFSLWEKSAMDSLRRNDD